MTHDVFTNTTTPVAPTAYRPCDFCEGVHGPGEACDPLYTTARVQQLCRQAFGLGLVAAGVLAGLYTGVLRLWGG